MEHAGMEGKIRTPDEVYGAQGQRAEERIQHLLTMFHDNFPGGNPRLFSAPGRTEIIGNHVDHNGGRILAASITLDTICAAEKTDDKTIVILSEGYQPIQVELAALSSVPKESGSISLVAGLAEAAQHFGYRIGGFRAVVTTEVIAAAGVSSSASFEMLLCAVIDHLYNGGTIDYAHYARMGQYAENRWWNKASGLMDQMACAVGGTILLDFSEGVRYESVDFSFDRLDMDLFIVNTGKGHADLSAEYSSIPHEMHEVAEVLGVKQLSDSNEETLLSAIPSLRKTLKNDRAILRALHYYEECRRVDEAVEALRRGQTDRVLSLINAGGASSLMWLQNGYCCETPGEQSVPLMLALSERYIRSCGSGACRLHGGGFAGVIMAVLPRAERKRFFDYIAAYAGKENVYVMGIRGAGAVELSA